MDMVVVVQWTCGYSVEWNGCGHGCSMDVVVQWFSLINDCVCSVVVVVQCMWSWMFNGCRHGCSVDVVVQWLWFNGCGCSVVVQWMWSWLFNGCGCSILWLWFSGCGFSMDVVVQWTWLWLFNWYGCGYSIDMVMVFHWMWLWLFSGHEHGCSMGVDVVVQALKKRLQERLRQKEETLAKLHEQQLNDELSSCASSTAAKLRRIAIKHKHMVEMEQFR